MPTRSYKPEQISRCYGGRSADPPLERHCCAPSLQRSSDLLPVAGRNTAGSKVVQAKRLKARWPPEGKHAAVVAELSGESGLREWHRETSEHLIRRRCAVERAWEQHPSERMPAGCWGNGEGHNGIRGVDRVARLL